jgi:hypothetical protein
VRRVTNTKYANLLSFIDLLFNLMLGFATMFLLTLAMISASKNQEESIKRDVEYVLRIEWRGDSDSDIDMWVQDPSGDMIGYRDKQRNNMFLERDNTGNDITLKQPGHINEEIVSVLKTNTGWYTVNLHYFQKRSAGEPQQVTWSIIKMKPSIQTVATGTVSMNQEGQEKTAVRFIVNKDGQVEKTDPITQNLFVLKYLGKKQ